MSSLASKLAIAFIITFTLGCIALFFGIRHIQNVRNERNAYNQAVLNQKKEDVSVTFPEGRRREEYAAILESKGICKATDFLAASIDTEGSLFPDTYRFFPDTSASQVVKALTDNFNRKTASLKPSQEQLTLASLVEREAKTDTERPLIAGVYQNRVTIGMKLDADPTVQYGKDSNTYEELGEPLAFQFWQPITRADYQSVSSPYNTYRTAGLPPSPIANPGLKSIAAAMSPAEHEYLYFLHRNGQLLLSKTLAEHTSKQ